MFERKTWKVKCPRCKKKWNFTTDKLLQGPMYKYCRGCLKVERDTGRGVMRGSLGPLPNFRSMDREDFS